MKSNKFLITILVILIVGAISSLWINPVRNIMAEIVSPFSKVINNSANGIGGFFNNIKSIKNLLKENTQLKQDNLSLQAQLDNLKEVKHQNNILLEEIGFSKNQTQFELIPSQVTGRGINGFLQSIKINCGSKDGVKEGAAVLSSGFLIGKISKVYETNAEVTLITNSNSLIPVVLQDSRGTGLLKGGLSGLIIEDIALDSQIKSGEVVLTSGLGGDLPSGISVGKTENIISSNSEIFQRVSVKSPIEFSKLEIVFVIKN